jgi:hypothetical protein
MPRKSANEIATEVVVAPVPFKHERPDPPDGMPLPQAAIWRDAVSSMRAGWFSRETHALLCRYCNSMAECERLEGELARMDIASPEYERVSKRRSATATTALAYARSLKITPLSNKCNTANARDPARSLYPRPWERGDGSGDGDGDSSEQCKRPWEDS